MLIFLADLEGEGLEFGFQEAYVVEVGLAGLFERVADVEVDVGDGLLVWREFGGGLRILKAWLICSCLFHHLSNSDLDIDSCSYISAN